MKEIHIIEVYSKGEKLSLKSLNYKGFEDKTVRDLEKYINDKNFFNGGQSLFIDEVIKKRIIAYLGHKSGKINWNLNIRKVKIETFFEALNQNEIFFNASGGYGCTDMFSLLEIIKNVISLLFNIIKNLFHLCTFLSYRHLEKSTCKNKAYIIDVIKEYDNWSLGFLLGKDSKNNLFVEKVVMKNLGFKLLGRIWKKFE